MRGICDRRSGALAVWEINGNQIEAANDLKVGQTSVAGNPRLCLRRKLALGGWFGYLRPVWIAAPDASGDL